MKETTRHKQIKKTILAGLMNLYSSQSDLDFNKFTLITLESLMLLEREEYLKSARGQADSGNGSYLRNFRSLCSNSLSISIPRSRHGIFKPMTLVHDKKINDRLIFAIKWRYKRNYVDKS